MIWLDASSQLYCSGEEGARDYEGTPLDVCRANARSLLHLRVLSSDEAAEEETILSKCCCLSRDFVAALLSAAPRVCSIRTSIAHLFRRARCCAVNLRSAQRCTRDAFLCLETFLRPK